jgi:hypothetical protein
VASASNSHSAEARVATRRYRIRELLGMQLLYFIAIIGEFSVTGGFLFTNLIEWSLLV